MLILVHKNVGYRLLMFKSTVINRSFILTFNAVKYLLNLNFSVSPIRRGFHPWIFYPDTLINKVVVFVVQLLFSSAPSHFMIQSCYFFLFNPLYSGFCKWNTSMPEAIALTVLTLFFLQS